MSLAEDFQFGGFFHAVGNGWYSLVVALLVLYINNL
jgi:hypothetical protein